MLVLQRTRPVVKSMPMSAVFSLLLSQVVGACSFFAANALLRAQFVAWTSEEDTQKTLAPELSALSGGTCFAPRRPAALLVPQHEKLCDLIIFVIQAWLRRFSGLRQCR